MFIVPTDTPGVEIVRNVGVWAHPEAEGTHAYVRYNSVRVPADHLLGGRGQGFAVAQTRLGGGRIHHAMRTVGLVRAALDMMLERAVSRETKGARLADLQLVQEMHRRLVDPAGAVPPAGACRPPGRSTSTTTTARSILDISAVKAAMPKVLLDVAGRAIQIHGSLGVSTEMPFGQWVLESFHMGLADGATELHKIQVAKQLLRGVRANPDLFPSGHLPGRTAMAQAKYADVLAARDELNEAVEHV